MAGQDIVTYGVLESISLAQLPRFAFLILGRASLEGRKGG